jgi:hypothetical protein
MQLKLYILEKKTCFEKRRLEKNFSKAALAGFEKNRRPAFLKTLPVIPTLVWGVQKGRKRSLHLIELFPNLNNFSNFYLQEALQQQFS